VSIVLKNTAWGVLGEISTRLAKLVQVVLMARLLGAEEVGRFNFALALAGMFSVLFDFGVLTVAVKELAQNRIWALRLYGRLKLLTSAVGLSCIGLATVLMPMSPTDRYLSLGLGVYLAFNDLSSYVVVAYRARGQFWRETTLRTVLSVTQTLACVAALFAARRVEWVVVALVVSAVLGIVPLVREWTAQPNVAGADRGWAGLVRGFRQCVPLAMTVLVGTVYMNFDIVVLGRSGSMEEVGWYGIAVKTVFALLIMPLTYFQLATLPVFAAELEKSSLSEARVRWLRSLVYSTTVGALLNLSTAVVATELLAFVFGKDFAAGGSVLVAFTLIGFLFYLYTPIAQWLLLMGKQKWTLYIQMAAMATNVVLVLALVPAWGVGGAIVAASMTHFVIALGHFGAAWFLGGYTGREVEWSALLRLTLGFVLGIMVVQIGDGQSLVTKLTAVVLFVACAHKEIAALIRFGRERIRTR